MNIKWIRLYNLTDQASYINRSTEWILYITNDHWRWFKPILLCMCVWYIHYMGIERVTNGNYSGLPFWNDSIHCNMALVHRRPLWSMSSFLFHLGNSSHTHTHTHIVLALVHACIAGHCPTSGACPQSPFVKPFIVSWPSCSIHTFTHAHTTDRQDTSCWMLSLSLSHIHWILFIHSSGAILAPVFGWVFRPVHCRWWYLCPMMMMIAMLVHCISALTHIHSPTRWREPSGVEVTHTHTHIKPSFGKHLTMCWWTKNMCVYTVHPLLSWKKLQ